MVRVRFAPSPTGYLHVGSLHTVIYNKLFALRHGGKMFLRVEDTDQSRYVPGAVENLIRVLRWAGVEIDEGPYLKDDGTLAEIGELGPYTQSRRLDLYRRHADELLAKGAAYRCFCTAERLAELRKTQELTKQPTGYDRRCRDLDPEEAVRRAASEPHVIRFKMPLEGETAFDDLVRGRVSFDNALLDDLVLLKTDGFPTYHLAHVVDDHLMETTHVLRGEEWLPSTPKHLALFAAFGWEPPRYAHLPLLLNPDRSKLSKRQGDVAVEDYRAKGYLPEALVNFVALMGWNPTDDREIFSLAELGELFDITAVNKAGAVFNTEKLDWLNREYLKALPPERLLAEARPFLAKAGFTDGRAADDAYVARALALEQQRVTTLAELPEAISFFLDEDYPLDPAILPWRKSTPPEAKDRLAAVAGLLRGLPDETCADPKSLEEKIMALIAERGWGNGDTLWPMRVALSGRAASPGPFEIAAVLGRDEAISRLERAANLL